MTFDIYARSIDRRWRRMLRDSDATVWVFSPYLTSPTAISVLSHVKPAMCEVHTVCSIESFVSGASSIRTLQQLLDCGFGLFHIDNLHAKVVIVSGKQATIGSQNVTSRGASNLEASVVITDDVEVTALQHMVQRWIQTRRPITAGELSDIEQLVKPLRRKFSALRRGIHAAEDATETTRKARKERETARTNAIDVTLGTLARMAPDGLVPYETAHDLIWRSIWWLTSKHGAVRSHKYADRIRGSATDWYLQIGANQFLISRAVRRCVDRASRFVASLKQGSPSDRAQLQSTLREAVAGAVANSSGVEYHGLYPLQGSELRFGAQAIDVDDFIRAFLQRCGVDALLSELERINN